MGFNFKKFINDVDSKLDSAISSATEYTKRKVIPTVQSTVVTLTTEAGVLLDSAKEETSNLVGATTAKLQNWSRENNANNIPAKYHDIVKTGLIASAAAGPLGVVSGPADTLAIAGIWSTMFIAIRNKSGKRFGDDPARITKGVAAGIVKYYIGCKLATYACFLIPGAGIFVGMSASTVCNIYFTYNFASIIIELMDTKQSYSDDDIIKEMICLLKKTPTAEEIREIVYIYSH